MTRPEGLRFQPLQAAKAQRLPGCIEYGRMARALYLVQMQMNCNAAYHKN